MAERIASRASGRRIVVAVGDDGPCTAALAWALLLAEPVHDELLLVRSYRPIALPGCGWDPVVRANGTRRSAAQRETNAALAEVRRSGSGIGVEGYTVAGDLLDALVELGQVADLVISDRQTLGVPRAKELVRAAPCAVALVGGRPRPNDTRPVAVEVDRPELPRRLVELGLDIAHRRSTGLLLTVSFSLGLPGEPADRREVRGWETAEQEQLDSTLAALEDRHPDVPVTVALRGESPYTSTRRLLETSQVLAIPRWEGRAIPLTAVAMAGPAETIVVVPVPTREPARAGVPRAAAVPVPSAR